MSDPPAVVAILGLGTVRLVGGILVLGMMLGFLYVVVRHGESGREGTPDDDGGSTLPSLGPAYGAGGDSVDEVLAGERDHPEPPDEVAADGAAADDDLGPPEVLEHRVISRRAGELVVEVTDGDRTGRFYVEDPDANPTISSASPGTDREDDAWVRTATEYLRAAVLAGEFEGERGTGLE